MGGIPALQDLAIQAYERCRAVGYHRHQGSALNDLGEVARLCGDYATAQSYYEQSLRILHEIGDRRFASVVYCNLGVVANAQGSYAEAHAWAEQGRLLAHDVGDPWMEGSFACTLGDALLGLGRPVEAAAAHQSAINTFRELGLPHEATAALAGLARVTLARGDVAAALAQIEEILAYLADGGTLDGINEPLRVFLTCYEVLCATGDSRAACVLETAYTTLQEQAAKLADDAMRRMFLENVPYHREIVAAWAEVIDKDH